jgi:hypothetical protein
MAAKCGERLLRIETWNMPVVQEDEGMFRVGVRFGAVAAAEGYRFGAVAAAEG